MTEARHVFDVFHDSVMGGYTGTTKNFTAIATKKPLLSRQKGVRFHLRAPLVTLSIGKWH